MAIFIGRSDELKQFNSTLETVREGRGRCVLVTGEAGIGKSRLIDEIRMRAINEGFTVLTGNCFEEDRYFPYAPIIDILRSLLAIQENGELLDDLGPQSSAIVKLLPELASPGNPPQPFVYPDSELEKRYLLDVATRIFLQQVENQQLLVIVEDLHWSDEATQEFLLHLIRRIGNHPILLILSLRSGVDQAGFVKLMVELDRNPIAHKVTLRPFTRSEVSELLGSILNQPQGPSDEFAGAVYSLTEGNAFFTEEICTALIASGDIFLSQDQWRRKPLSQIELPESVQRSVQLRLDRLRQPARQLIRLAAVSGRSFDIVVIQTLTDLTESEIFERIKELMSARLIVEESANQFAFRHALTREALYTQLLERERQSLHAQMVEAIEHIHADSLDAQWEALAYHTSAAALWQKAVDYGKLAGEKALALFAPYAASEHFSRAIYATDQLGQPPDSALFRLRGRAFDTLGNFDKAREDYEGALRAAQAEGDQDRAWQILLDLGLLWASRDYERTGDYCRQALELAHEMKNPMAIGNSLNRLGNWLMNSGQLVEALDYHQDALAIFESLDDPMGIASTLDLLAMASNMYGDAENTVRYYQRAIPILRQVNDRQTLSSSLTMLSNYTLEEAQVREALEITRAIDWRAGEAFSLSYLASLLAFRGDYGLGLETALSSLELATAIDHHLWQAWSHIILGLIYYELLSLDDSYRHLHSGRSIAEEVGSDFMYTLSTGLLVSTCIQQGKLDEAETLLPENLPEMPVSAEYPLVKAALELVFHRQEDSRMADLLERLEMNPQISKFGGMAYYAGSASQLRAEILAHLGQVEDAIAEMQNILEQTQEAGIRMGLWRGYLAMGRFYQTNGELPKAREAFSTAQTTAGELAATIHEEGLQKNFIQTVSGMIPQLAQLGEVPTAKEKYGGLTRRERQVAAVIAQGMSNLDIADELVVSIKTVEAHVTHILSKLGFSSRAQVAAWAVEKGLASAPQDLDSLSTEN